MGCCVFDALPDIPDVLTPDPDANETIKAVVRRIGWARDYSVHKDAYPQNSEDVKQKMWMWINKSDGGVIDLENFVRGWNEQQPTKGKVFYSAIVTERPHFEQFQRAANSGFMDRFMGFFGQQSNSGYDSDDDSYYVNHHTHKAKFGQGRRHQGQPHHNMITKWRLNTRAVIRDGNLGRGADTLQGKDIILEVFSKGTAATGWEEVETRHTDEEGREHVTKRDEKRETEWVDRVEFRLSVGGAMWAEWIVQGDTHYNPGAAASIESPLFHTDIEGGWFAKSLYITTTKAGVDPALALLVAHLCYTEYSVAEIKGDLRPNTPASPPRSFAYSAPTQQMMYQGAAMSGQFQWGKTALMPTNNGYNNGHNNGYNNGNNNNGYNNGNNNNNGYNNGNNNGYNNGNNNGYNNGNNNGYNNNGQQQHAGPTTVNLGGGISLTVGGSNDNNHNNHGNNNGNNNGYNNGNYGNNGNNGNNNGNNHGNSGKKKKKKNRGNNGNRSGNADSSSSDSSSSDESDGGGGRRRRKPADRIRKKAGRANRNN